jgi:hypothetical protein
MVPNDLGVHQLRKQRHLCVGSRDATAKEDNIYVARKQESKKARKLPSCNATAETTESNGGETAGLGDFATRTCCATRLASRRSHEFATCSILLGGVL